METKNENNLATLIHLSALSQYFIPFGNYIFPILIWSSKKDSSQTIDFNGKQVINFQLSVFLYTVILLLIAVPIFITTVLNTIPLATLIHDHNFRNIDLNLANITGIITVGLTAILLLASLKVAELMLIIYAAVETANGKIFKYPLSIPFIK